MKRNWQHIEAYLDRLAGEVMFEPETSAHAAVTADAFRRFVVPNRERVQPALDIGCGPGAALALFQQHGIPAIGISLSEVDVRACRERGFDARLGDQSFLDFPDRHFGLVWSRHCLEHSPMPLLTLFEYNRVLRDDGLLYVEVPQHDSIHLGTPNHYSVLTDAGWRALFKRADFAVSDQATYTLVRRWPNSFVPAGFIEADDYYYAYWLRKMKHIAGGSTVIE